MPAHGRQSRMPLLAQGGRLHERGQQRKGTGHLRVLRRHQHAGRQPESGHGGVPQRGASAHREGAGQGRHCAQGPHGEQVEPEHQRPNRSRGLKDHPNVLKVRQDHAGGGLHGCNGGGEHGQPQRRSPDEALQQQAKADHNGEGRGKVGHFQEEQKQQNRGNDRSVRAPSSAPPPGDAQQKQHRQRGPAPTVVKADVRGHASAVARIPRHAGHAEDRSKEQQGGASGRPSAQGGPSQRQHGRGDDCPRRLQRAGPLPRRLPAQIGKEVAQCAQRRAEIHMGQPPMLQGVDPAEKREQIAEPVSLHGDARQREERKAERRQSDCERPGLPIPLELLECQGSLLIAPIP